MREKYVISVEEIEGYIKYLKNFKQKNEENKKIINKKLKDINEFWNDDVYNKTLDSLNEVDKQLEKLYISFDETIKCLNKMIKAYSDYLVGGK